MKKNIKFVIVGGGNIASTYMAAVNKIVGAEVGGVVSRKDKKPEALADLPFFKSISEINIDFDAVIICTPNGLHHFSAIEAANLGKHVLCEKPIDITLESIDKMIAACRENNVRLGVAYQRRYSSDNPAVKKLIDSGELGRIFSVDLSVKNYRDDAYYNSSPYRGTFGIDGGGPFIQQASHYIDLYCWFFGKPQKLVSQLGTFVHDIEVEDHGAAICVHDLGMIATITASTATKPGFPAKMEIYTSKGYLILENDVITHWDIEGVENPTAQTENENTHTGAATAAVADTANHETILNDFVNAIKTGEDCLVTGESARTATEMILEIYNGQF
ncbi:Gfo/Idh/MocA family oxidoreductase [Flavobacteriaceae bacterium GSB9]|nr:Gfo/Idh/MocA family oxidoreductase [Flavobacteriaceae bacterium GSB9]